MIEGYKIIKIRDPTTQRLGLLFTVSYPEIKNDVRPRRRFMSAFEQKREIPNRALQYLVASSQLPLFPFLEDNSLYRLAGGRTVRDNIIRHPIKGDGRGRRGSRGDMGTLGCGRKSIQLSIVVQVGSTRRFQDE